MSYSSPTRHELERLATYSLVREGAWIEPHAVRARIDELRSDEDGRDDWLAEVAPELDASGARGAFRRIVDGNGLLSVFGHTAE